MRVQFTTTLDKELLDSLKIRAIKEGKNVNEILEQLIKEHLSEEEEK